MSEKWALSDARSLACFSMASTTVSPCKQCLPDREPTRFSSILGLFLFGAAVGSSSAQRHIRESFSRMERDKTEISCRSLGIPQRRLVGERVELRSLVLVSVLVLVVLSSFKLDDLTCTATATASADQKAEIVASRPSVLFPLIKAKGASPQHL